MVRSAGLDPRFRGRLEIRDVPIHHARDRKLRHLLFLSDELQLGADQAEMRPQIHERDRDGVTRYGIENESGRVALAADTERMDLDLQFLRGKHRGDFEHV